jgi:hypothetical protein
MAFGVVVVTPFACKLALLPVFPDEPDVESGSNGVADATPVYRMIPPEAIRFGLIVHVYEASSEEPATFQ